MIDSKEKIAAEAAARALSILPASMKSDIVRALGESGVRADSVTDIRLRREGRSYITADGRSYPINANISPHRFDEMIFALTGGSLYAHAETIREGYISVGGIRCGVCGRAVMKDGAISEVSDIGSVTIRIARDISGCSDRVYDLITRGGTLSGALIYSPPGGGKTTLLRDLIRKLSLDGHQFSVIDARRELGAACRGGSADVLVDYPKDEGIRCAVRSLSPELIICDELSGDRDARAALYAYACGVPIVATAHAGSTAELRSRREIRELLDSGVFMHTIGIDGRRHVISLP